eukprot:GHVP01068774.1.p1 GENE.GHVP01068774.1~~GHVP01068774.1.p1  ORF type:complete len:157 (+),score=3.08 GHVP01068774.1:232-702(+)
MDSGGSSQGLIPLTPVPSIGEQQALKFYFLLRSSPHAKWGSPAFCYHRSLPFLAGTWRTLVDYRSVNRRIIRDSYPLPKAVEIFRGLRGRGCFSSWDLAAGFWNLRLTPRAQQYCGFHVPGRGIFTSTVLPFGLIVSHNVFPRVMEKALAPLLTQI